MGLSYTEWVDLLSEDYSLGGETVIIVVGKLPRTLKIKKDDWKAYFPGFGGIGFKQGDEVEIVPKADGGPSAAIPDWARERLASGSSDAICITRKDGKYYLKKLELVEQPSEAPGCMVFDRFRTDSVERTYWNRTAPDEFNYDVIDKLLSAMPKFRHDPVAPFKDMDGRLGMLARKEFLGGITKADKSMMEDHKKELCQDQQENGSWQDSAAHTAFKLIRLLEVGATMKEPAVEKAVGWLLEAKDPLGLPGLFMFSEKTADSFSAWKEKQEPGSRKRGSRNPTPAQRRFFLDNRDVFGVSNAYCELKLTWSTAIALEALLRCGLHQEPRVVKAINTLFSMSSGGGWCGCGYFVANIYHDESTAPVDFNRFRVQYKGRRPGSIELERNDILKLACNHHYRGFALKDGRTMMARTADQGSGDCPMVVHKALSYHPDYHGSNMETIAAVLCSHRQGWLGDWTGNYTSFFFSLLARSRCPLSAYLVLRTVPLLVRKQGPDGFWQEEELPSDPKRPLEVPTKEESTFMILTALKTFGLLDALRPI